MQREHLSLTGKGKPKESDFETSYKVLTFDAELTVDEYRMLPRNGIHIILDNLRSAFNVGSIFRLCDAMRVSGLYLCGYTPHPPHFKLDKTSLGTTDYVPWKWFETTAEALCYCKSINLPVWAAETTTRSKMVHEVVFPENLAIVFGNEALGISRPVLDMCDEFIQIPLYGFKNSINVATSCAVIGFKILESMARSKKVTAAIHGEK
jgi:tRNA G18 (ribose-2'-O)-methylase SpoU